MSNSPNYASIVTVGAKILTTANGGSRAAPTNTQTVFTPAGSAGGQVERIVIEPVATTIAGTVQIFRFDGSSYWLYAEVQLPVFTASASVAIAPITLEAVDYPSLFPIVIPNAWTLVAGLSVAQSGICVQVEGGSF